MGKLFRRHPSAVVGDGDLSLPAGKGYPGGPGLHGVVRQIVKQQGQQQRVSQNGARACFQGDLHAPLSKAFRRFPKQDVRLHRLQGDPLRPQIGRIQQGAGDLFQPLRLCYDTAGGLQLHLLRGGGTEQKVSVALDPRQWRSQLVGHVVHKHLLCLGLLTELFHHVVEAFCQLCKLVSPRFLGAEGQLTPCDGLRRLLQRSQGGGQPLQQPVQAHRQKQGHQGGDQQKRTGQTSEGVVQIADILSQHDAVRRLLQGTLRQEIPHPAQVGLQKGVSLIGHVRGEGGIHRFLPRIDGQADPAFAVMLAEHV